MDKKELENKERLIHFSTMILPYIKDHSILRFPPVYSSSTLPLAQRYLHVPWNQDFSYSQVKSLVDVLSSNTPIVSAGTTSGAFEARYRAESKANLQLTCIEEPNMFQRYIGSDGQLTPETKLEQTIPDFPTFESYLEKTKSVDVGNCSLLLLNPDSSGSENDMDVILALKPKHIVIRCESSGSAGSDLLHSFLIRLGCKGMGWPLTDEVWKTEKGMTPQLFEDYFQSSGYHRIAFDIQSRHLSPWGTICPMLVLVSRAVWELDLFRLAAYLHLFPNRE